MVTAVSDDRILVVDDNVGVHEAFHSVLAGAATTSPDFDDLQSFLFEDAAPARSRPVFSVDSAFQGEQALHLVEEAVREGRPYGLAFVDMRMPPGWDGVETIMRLWQACADLEVVICTAYADQDWDEIAERIGGTDRLLILKKPFDIVEIRQMAHALSCKHRLRREARIKLEELERRVEDRTTELKQAIEALERMTLEDALTGIANRRAFDRTLEIELRRASRAGQPLSLLIADLDHFKELNDCLGHQRGDACLQAVAAALAAHVRRAGDMVARYGGEEFAVILPHTDSGGAGILAERLRSAVENLAIPRRDDPDSPVVTVSVGAATTAPPGRVDAAALVAQADEALYDAKRAGRNAVRARGFLGVSDGD